MTAQKKLQEQQESISRKVAAAALQSQETERNFLSRELHDNVNQVLTTVKLYTELCAAGTMDPSAVLPKCAELLNSTINEIRRLSKQLARPAINEVSLSESLIELVELINDTNQVKLHLDVSPHSCRTIAR